MATHPRPQFSPVKAEALCQIPERKRQSQVGRTLTGCVPIGRNFSDVCADNLGRDSLPETSSPGTVMSNVRRKDVSQVADAKTWAHPGDGNAYPVAGTLRGLL